MLITMRHNRTMVRHYYTKCILITKAIKTRFVLLTLLTFYVPLCIELYTDVTCQLKKAGLKHVKCS